MSGFFPLAHLMFVKFIKVTVRGCGTSHFKGPVLQDNPIHLTMAGYLDFFQFGTISSRTTMDDGYVYFGECVLVFLSGILPGAQV